MEYDPEEVIGWVRAFAFTQCIEVPLYVLALSRWGFRMQSSPAAKRWLFLLRCATVAFVCSLCTHPFVWFAFPRLIDSSVHYLRMVVFAEIFAVSIEAALLWAVGLRRAWLVSLCVNMTSLGLGLLFRYTLGLV